jgi:hypothetical protein
MGLKVEFDADSVIATIAGVGRDASREAFNALKEGGKEIRDLAREYAPVDDGDLENAIVSEPVARETTVHVGIDPRATDELGRSVNGYGQMLHEMQTIGGGSVPAGMGLYGLGPKSQAKDGGRNVVGGKFLERAYQEKVREILRKTGIRVKRLINMGVRGGEGE